MWGSGGDIDVAHNLAHLSLNFNGHSGHLWFVYMLLGLYLVMPIITPWLERLTKRGEELFLGLWLFTTAIPFFRELALSIGGTAEVWGEANWNEFGMLYYVSGFIGFVVAAHYIRTYINWSVARTLAITLPMIIVGYVVTALPFYYQIPSSYPIVDSIDLAIDMELSWRFSTTGVALMTIGVFLIFKLIERPSKCYKAIADLSMLSYGIYLVHMFVLVAIYDIVSSWSIGTPLTMVVTAALTFAISAILIKLLALLPKSKYIVG